MTTELINKFTWSGGFGALQYIRKNLAGNTQEWRGLHVGQCHEHIKAEFKRLKRPWNPMELHSVIQGVLGARASRRKLGEEVYDKVVETCERQSQRQLVCFHDALINADKLRYLRHGLRVSVVDKTQVAYAPTWERLRDDKLVRMKAGRYLMKEWSDKFSESQIKRMAEEFAAAQAPRELKFVESDDPDGWVRVYESGSGFTSCMVFDREDRHICSNYCDGDKNHPVRVYARPGNGLRLAYFGVGTRVFARSIVREKPKGYVRIYGDESLFHALKAAGYERQVGLAGVKLQKVKLDERGRYLMPYLDGCSGAAVMPDHLVACEQSECRDHSEEYLDASAEGHARVRDADYGEVACHDCGDPIDEDEVSVVNDNYYCDNCLNNSFAYAYTGRRTREWVRQDSAYYCEGTGEYYTDAGLDAHGLALTSGGDIYPLDEVVEITHGRYVGYTVHHDDAVELNDKYYDEGSFAMGRDVEGGILKEDVRTCALTGEKLHYSELVYVSGAGHYFSPDAVMQNLHKFSVDPGPELLLGDGHMPLSIFLQWNKVVDLRAFKNLIFGEHVDDSLFLTYYSEAA